MVLYLSPVCPCPSICLWRFTLWLCSAFHVVFVFNFLGLSFLSIILLHLILRFMASVFLTSLHVGSSFLALILHFNSFIVFVFQVDLVYFFAY